jgi:tetratricopeptide (TPR) repeat protein
MAKTCNVCRRTYPDNLNACPHCAKARAEDSSVIRLHDPNQTSDWEEDPSSSGHLHRGDAITVDPDADKPAGAPSEPVKKKTQLAPKGRETKLHGMPADEADLGRQPSKPGSRSAPETMIAQRDKPKSPPSGGSSDEIRLEDKSGSSDELRRQKKEGSSVEINLDKKKPGSSVEISLEEQQSGSSEELERKKNPGSSVEISLEEKKSGSSVELDRKKKSGSSVEKRSGSSLEINLDEKEDDGSPSSSLLLGGPGSDSGSGEPSSSDVKVGRQVEGRGSEMSTVDLGSSLEVHLPEEKAEAVESDSSEVVARQEALAVAAEPPRRTKKGSSGLGLLIGAGAGLLVASLVWIFGPLDGLRGSLRETVGLSADKKPPVGYALKQPGLTQVAKQQDDEDAPAAKSDQGVKPAPAEDTKETKPAPASVSQPVEKKPEIPPAPATTVEKPAPDKNLEVITMVAEAAKLAQDQKYPEARAMLQKARTAGAPTDDGLRRFCDELQASWQMREKLGSAGYLGKQKDPLQALDALLKEKKDTSTTIAGALEKIKAGKNGNLNEAIDSLLDSAKKADEQAKSAQAAMKKLEKEKEDSQASLTTAATLLKQGKYVDEQSPNLAQGVEKLLADKKNSDTQVKEATSRLKDAEETIQDITKKLVDPKYVPQGPAPQVTTSAKISPPDISVAEKYYSTGLTHFWTGDYAAAEKDFATAIRFYKDDARFFYYFGLSCWQEGKRTEASEAFQKGNVLELQSRPSSTMINATFERVQGAARKALDQERERPQVENGKF